MAFSERSLDDYVDVAQRIADFRAKHPEGSLQPANRDSPYEIATVTGYDKNGEPVTQSFIVYVAAAYRHEDDPRPGIGSAWEVFPGRTPYTRGSELQNAETSAWGRAIIAVLASDSKAGIASREEVANRRAEREDGLPTNADGSLSRSRTTDAEKDRAGVMTAAQQAEHTRLQPKRAEQTGQVTRIRPQEVEGNPTGGRVAKRAPVTTPPSAGQGAPATAGATPGPRVTPGCTLSDPCHRPDCSACYPENFMDPPADPWLDQPAGHLPHETEHAPGSVSPQQQRAIHAACTGMGRDQRLATISDIIGRPVTSSNELSYTEAATVLGKLAKP